MKKNLHTALQILAILVLCFLIFLAIICGYLAGAMLQIAKESPEVHADRILSDLKENSQILDANGNLIEQIETTEYRKIVPYEEIPKNLINAFISAEDRRFMEHDGVDLIGIAATVRDFLTSGDLRGASTITMQLARNVYLNNDVNWTRKIQEIFLAYQIDDQLSKEQIITSYLNRIFFGQNAYGVQAAAQIYFSKDVKDLSLAQCAALASIVPAPSQYALYSTYRPSQVTDERVLDETQINGERYLVVYNPPAYKRAHWVLEQMKKNGYISEAEYNEAINTDVSATINAPDRRAENVSTYITDLVKEQTINILMDTQHITENEAREMLMYGGLTITSTVDMDLQRKLQDKAASFTSTLTSPTGTTDPLQLKLDYDDSGNIIGRDGNLLYYRASNLMDDQKRFVLPDSQYDIDADGNLIIYRGRIVGHQGYLELSDYYTFDDDNVLHTHQVGTIPIDEKYLSLDDAGTMHIDKAAFSSPDKEPLYEIKDDGSLVLNPTYYTVDELGVKQPQIAFTVLDSQSGQVRAIIGGREQDDRHFLNRAALYPRQPGSSIKPIAEYTAALAAGNNAGVAQEDAPFEMLDNHPWPVNVDGRYRGLLSMQEALVLSSNPVAVRWLNTVGIEAAKEYLARYGIINRDHPERDHFVEAKEDGQFNDENLSLAIGAMTHGLTTLDMAGAYQSIANNGVHVPAMSVLKIVDNSGHVYYENKGEGNPVLSPQLNYQLLSMLRHVVNDGYASSTLVHDGIDMIGKTGTTTNEMDFWFAGASPYYSTAIWVGADSAQLSLEGDSAVASNLFANITAILNEGKDDKAFAVPDGVRNEEVSDKSGQFPTDATRSAGGVMTIPVSDETAPKNPDPVYVFRQVDTRNNLLAADDTPSRFRDYRVFLDRPAGYEPGTFGGIVPEDWNRNIPSAYSDLGAFMPDESRTNPDGTTTKRVYNQQDGSYTETTVLLDGSTQVTSFDADGHEKSTTITRPTVPNPAVPGAAGTATQ